MKEAIYTYNGRDKKGVLVHEGWVVFKKPWYKSWGEAIEESLAQLRKDFPEDMQRPIITFFCKL